MSHMHELAFGSSWVSIALVSVAVAYARGWYRLRRSANDKILTWRAGGFLLGLLFIWAAAASPLAALDHQLLTAHMVQHLLLMTFAPPLILLGHPVSAFADGLSQRFVQMMGRSFRLTPMRRLENLLTHPVIAWLAASATLVVWHIPAVFTLGLRSGVWHEIEQACFLATGLLFWCPVIPPRPGAGKWPESAILLYLFLATLPCDILSGFLVFCDRVVYPVFLSSPQSFGMSALEDQQCAGALMWTCVTVVYLIAGAIVSARWLSFHQPNENGQESYRSAMEAIEPR